MEKEIYEIQITISNLNKEDYESLMVKTKELAAASKKEVKVANKNIVKSDVNGQLSLAELEEKELIAFMAGYRIMRENSPTGKYEFDFAAIGLAHDYFKKWKASQ